MQTFESITEHILPINLFPQLLMTDIDKLSGNRLHKKVVSENFDRVILINPQLNNLLNLFISDLADADVQVVVISNELGRREDLGHEDEARERAISLLMNSLPNNLFWSSNGNCLFELVNKARKKMSLGSRKELVITSFTPEPIVAGLPILGQEFPVTEQDKIYLSKIEDRGKLSSPVQGLWNLIIGIVEGKNLSSDRIHDFNKLLQAS